MRKEDVMKEESRQEGKVKINQKESGEKETQKNGGKIRWMNR